MRIDLDTGENAFMLLEKIKKRFLSPRDTLIWLMINIHVCGCSQVKIHFTEMKGTSVIREFPGEYVGRSVCRATERCWEKSGLVHSKQLAQRTFRANQTESTTLSNYYLVEQLQLRARGCGASKINATVSNRCGKFE